MNLMECYQGIGGNYEVIMGRLKKEERVVKYVKKFAGEDTLGKLKAALDREDYEEAFMHSHNLKGMCANLEFSRLGASASELTECLRGGTPSGDYKPLLAKVEEDYELTVSVIGELDE